MGKTPDAVARFLSGKRIAVAGVSRDSKQPANAIYRKLRESGYEVYPVNPKSSEVEGVSCYPNLGAVSGPLDGVVVATHPRASIEIVREAHQCGVAHLWFHRSFGRGSVSVAAVQEGKARGLECIVGGCPLMYCEPVDAAHRCMRWWLGLRKRVPV